MPRPPRLEFPGALYHVTARGNERRALYRDDADREEYLARLAHYRRKFGFRLLSYCLMRNHVHLAIRAGPTPLSRVMAGLHSSYAEWFNRRHARVGHLFQGRYTAFLVQEQRYLHALVRYIHRNPVEARIVPRAQDYKWSSDRFFRKGRGPAWLDVDDLLALLADSRALAVRGYAALVDGAGSEPVYERAQPRGQAVVGDSHFAAERLREADGDPVPLRGIDVDDILAAVARDSGVSLAELAGPRPGGHLAAARCRAAYVASRFARIPIRRVARRLGRDDSSFSRPLDLLQHRLDTDLELRARIDRLVESLRTPPPLPRESTNQD
jgi:REP-associated tyrosine transposase